MNATPELTGQDRAKAATAKLAALIQEIDLAACEEIYPEESVAIYQLRDELIAAKNNFEVWMRGE